MDHSGKPVFRNPDKVQVLAWRDWLRENMPIGRDGFVAEDLDLIVLRFGKLENRPHNKDGKFMLIEVKQCGKTIDYPQKRTFGLIDRLLRLSDPDKDYYIGFYVINWNDDHVVVNQTEKLDMPNLKRFLLGEFEIVPMKLR